MIYRIAIYRNDNGKMVFDHYATNEEISILRINTSGKVEKLGIKYWQYTVNNERLIETYWYDVSSTHEVEWGFVIEGNKYFQNDIIYNKHYKNKYLTIMWDADDCQFVIGESTDVYVEEMYLFNLPEWWTVIGNIHQNSELLEVKE
jgi:hypothetical protein